MTRLTDERRAALERELAEGGDRENTLFPSAVRAFRRGGLTSEEIRATYRASMVFAALHYDPGTPEFYRKARSKAQWLMKVEVRGLVRDMRSDADVYWDSVLFRAGVRAGGSAADAPLDLSAALVKLTPKQAAAVTAKYLRFPGLSPKEVAEATDWPGGVRPAGTSAWSAGRSSATAPWSWTTST